MDEEINRIMKRTEERKRDREWYHNANRNGAVNKRDIKTLQEIYNRILNEKEATDLDLIDLTLLKGKIPEDDKKDVEELINQVFSVSERISKELNEFRELLVLVAQKKVSEGGNKNE